MDEPFLEKVSYRINRHNIIVDAFNDWNKAATAGRAGVLTDLQNVIGKNLFLYLQDDTTRMYYSTIFQKCRLLQKSHLLEYRCDSPTHMRFMKMEVIPYPNNDIVFNNYLIREEPFSYRVNIHVNQNTVGTEFNVRCSICNRLKLDGNNEWVSPESMAKEKEQNIFVIHSVCLDCQKRIRK